MAEGKAALVEEGWCRWGEAGEVDTRDCRVAIDFAKKQQRDETKEEEEEAEEEVVFVY